MRNSNKVWEMPDKKVEQFNFLQSNPRRTNLNPQCWWRQWLSLKCGSGSWTLGYRDNGGGGEWKLEKSVSWAHTMRQKINAEISGKLKTDNVVEITAYTKRWRQKGTAWESVEKMKRRETREEKSELDTGVKLVNIERTPARGFPFDTLLQYSHRSCNLSVDHLEIQRFSPICYNPVSAPPLCATVLNLTEAVIFLVRLRQRPSWMRFLVVFLSPSK
jgi:hypothetical protein